jgi:hypothetical protein
MDMTIYIVGEWDPESLYHENRPAQGLKPTDGSNGIQRACSQTAGNVAEMRVS